MNILQLGRGCSNSRGYKSYTGVIRIQGFHPISVGEFCFCFNRKINFVQVWAWGRSFSSDLKT